jgi:transposase
MRGPKPLLVKLSETERQELEQLVRRHGTAQQVAVRGRVVLRAAEGLNNAQIARELALDVDTVRLWRHRWLGFQGVSVEDLSIAERLTDAPRPGRPAAISAEQVCQMIELACEAPQQAGRPISQWTGREIADEMVKRGIVTHISPRHPKIQPNQLDRFALIDVLNQRACKGASIRAAPPANMISCNGYATLARPDSRV